MRNVLPLPPLPLSPASQAPACMLESIVIVTETDQRKTNSKLLFLVRFSSRSPYVRGSVNYSHLFKVKTHRAEEHRMIPIENGRNSPAERLYAEKLLR